MDERRDDKKLQSTVTSDVVIWRASEALPSLVAPCLPAVAAFLHFCSVAKKMAFNQFWSPQPAAASPEKGRGLPRKEVDMLACHPTKRRQHRVPTITIVKKLWPCGPHGTASGGVGASNSKDWYYPRNELTLCSKRWRFKMLIFPRAERRILM